MLYVTDLEVAGWESAIRGMRNPMNSWDKSDSCFEDEWVYGLRIGKNDLDLMKRLRNAGTDHRKFMRMIVAYMDITAPLYWWKEFDTYKVGTVANSCSTMHKIADKEFTLDDFSHEHILDDKSQFINTHGDKCSALTLFENTLAALNLYRDLYLKTKEKVYWWQMIQMLPSSYNQKRTVMLNYETLASIYGARRNHKLDEWRDFCERIEEFPYSSIIVGDDANNDSCDKPKVVISPIVQDLRKALDALHVKWRDDSEKIGGLTFERTKFGKASVLYMHHDDRENRCLSSYGYPLKLEVANDYWYPEPVAMSVNELIQRVLAEIGE